MNITKTRVGVYGVIIKDNKIALVKKKNGGYKGKYDLPGGGMKFHEDTIETLKREIKEEIGRNVVNYKLLNVYTQLFPSFILNTAILYLLIYILLL